jgi:queuine tRNA-ribosyltransferase
MVLDHVLPLPADDAQVHDACQRTIRWARRCRDAARSTSQAQFGIVQGGLCAELRAQCAAELCAMEFTGYAIGGLSVGESADERNRILEATCPALPPERPRYLMGVGRPEDLLDAIARGVDLFDCVMPTRNGRNALAFTDEGPLRLRNLVHQLDDRPLDERTTSPASGHSRGYIRHLFMADEMLGPILLSLHNVAYYQRLMADARAAIEADQFAAFHAEKLRGWRRLGEAAGDA